MIKSVCYTGQRGTVKDSRGEERPVYMVSVWAEDEDGDGQGIITTYWSQEDAQDAAEAIASENGIAAEWQE